MNKKLFSVTTILLALALAAFAADVTGKWTFEQPGRNGPMTTTLNLKAEGSKLTGTMEAGAARGGMPPAEISNGKVEGDNLSFDITREFNGNSMTTKFKGKVAGDEMKLTVERPGRDGAPTVQEMTAKRTK